MSAKLSSPILVLAQSQVTPFLLKDRLMKYGFDLIHIENAVDLPKIEKNHPAPGLVIIEISQQFAEKGVVDFVHYCRQSFPECHIAVTYAGSPPFPLTNMIRNGVQHTFQLPFEEEILFNKLFEIYDEVDIPPEKLDLDAMTRVFVPEIEEYSALPFDVFVYLPRNNKVIRYGKKNRPIEQKLKQKFGDPENPIPLYVRKNDLHLYRKHFVKQLTSISNSQYMDEHERSESLRKELGRFMSGLFQQEELSATESQAMLAIVRNSSMEYLRETSSNKEIFDRIYALSNECSSNYNHAVNVSMYAALFAIMMGYSNTEDFVMAGLLHDIGLSMIDPEVAVKDVEEMNEKEFNEYKQHPIFSVDLMSRKKIPANSIVMKTILQHHERPDGTGYPHGESEAEIHEFARICAIADVFDELTSVNAGKILYSPKDALEKIAGINGDEPLAGFDLDIHRKLLLAIMENDMGIEIAS